MKTKSLFNSNLLNLTTLILSELCFFSKVNSQTLSLPENLINLNSTTGETLLIESNARKDYLPLSNYFVTQDNLAYCGVASLVMVLNALTIPAPETPKYRTYRIFTQENFFNNPETEKVMTAQMVSRGGMTLAQLNQLLKSYSVKTQVYYGSDVTLDEFRQLIQKNLQEANNFVLINYLRKTIQQQRGGHISPIAAYNEESDRFLILDVARYKYPPIWVKAEELWEAIKTTDSVSQKTRGFVLVSGVE